MIEGVVNAANESLMALAIQGASGRVSEAEVVAETRLHWFLAPDTTPFQGT